MTLSGRAKLAGVMGWPVSHSLSPRLHGFWLERHGIDGAYVPLPVRPQDFGSAVRSLADLGFRGVNVTLPHKEAALAACDEIDPTAARIGAVNTIRFQDGRLLGSNSDAFGFVENLNQGASGWDAAKAPAVVLGAGGAARAVVWALVATGLSEIRLVNRTVARAEALKDAIGGPITVHGWDQAAATLGDAGLLVNTTSLGMTGQGPLDLDLDSLPAAAVVTDLVYNPLETALLAQARARGHRCVDGLGMLLHQARPGFESWFGVRPAVDAALRDFVLAA